MKVFQQKFSSERGVALVIALALVALLAILVVSYLYSMQLDRQSTQNYSQSVKAQELALGGLQEIIGDLRQEIDAGSLQAVKYKVNGKRVYIPASARSSLPARIGFPAAQYGTDASSDVLLPPTLLRVSRAADPFFSSTSPDYPGTLPVNRASAAKSTEPSANGRVFSAARWNKPQMMGKMNPSNPAVDLLPPANFSAAPPDWVYVTRNGSRVFQNSDVNLMKLSKNLSHVDEVLGRYAFVMYEEGGLLDVNAAGYPSTLGTTAGGAAAIRGKTALAYADLMQLPGTTGKENQLDAFLEWRSKGSLVAPTYGNGNFNLMVQKLLPEGFLKFQSGDSPLVSRQDLIDYFKKKMISTAPLPYLGTFSRSVSAPSWTPQNPAGSAVDYAANANLPASANRNLANLRFKTSAVVTHYKDDYTSATYQVEEGDPLLQSRFSLGKLAWLKNPDTGEAPPSAAHGKAIQACFGLVWDQPGGTPAANTTANGGNKCWNYVGSTGSLASPPGTIETLEQVASEGREPNFFELLKAAILSGSLGKNAGKAAFDNGKNRSVAFPGGSSPYDAHQPPAADTLGPVGLYCYWLDFLGGTVPAPAQVTDMQIIQIGANIIDQYDADSFPTAIYFKYALVGAFDPASSTGHPLFGPVTMVYGDENLPYLTRMVQLTCSPSRSGSAEPTDNADNATTSMAGWRQPELWNPHQQPATTPVDLPKNFQIRAYGSSRTYWAQANPVLDPAPNNPAFYYDGGHRSGGYSEAVNYFLTNKSTEISKVGTINITDSSTTSSFYAHPFLLTTEIPGVTASSPASTPAPPPSGDNIAKAQYPNYNATGNSTYNPNRNHFVAFATGVTVSTPPNKITSDRYQPFYVGPGTSNVGSCAVDSTGFGEANTYVLGWIDATGGFHPYSFLTGAFVYTYSVLTKSAGSSENRVGNVVPETPSSNGPSMWIQADPRTSRFSLSMAHFSNGLPYGNNSIFPKIGANWSLGYKPGDAGFTYAATSYLRDWAVNSSFSSVALNGAKYNTAYYSDPDGIVRPGDGIFSTPNQGDGMMLLSSDAAPTGSPLSSGDSAGNTQHGRRPVILNRPFLSVGDLGYVFRDLPFKTLDFFTQSSADAALLDVFCLTDTTHVTSAGLNSIVAGQVNPNSAPALVFQAILSGAGKKEMDPGYNLKTEAATLAQNIANFLNPAGGPAPLRSPADLVLGLGASPATGTGPVRNAFSSSPDKGNKAYLEAPLRALANVTNTRTWNLLIDVVAQSGRMKPGAGALGDFVVEGERRYWLHVSIDRYTGKIVDQQLEPVYE